MSIGATILPSHADLTEEAAIRKALDDLCKAMIAADKAGLEARVSNQLKFGHANGRVENKSEFIGAIVSRKVIYKSITVGDVAISFAGNNAIAHYPLSVEAEAGGKVISLGLHSMTVWLKDGGAWRLLAYQSVKA